MKIQSIRLENLTVFKDLTVNLSEGINVFIGKNGTGKTHLLKAIYGACEISKDDSHSSFEKYFKSGFGEVNLFKYDNDRNIEIYLKTNDVVREIIKSTLSVGPITFERIENNIPISRENYHIHLPENIIFKAIYIPVKDMLTHSKGLLAMMEKYSEFPFDKTLTDIINRASQWKLKDVPKMAKIVVPILAKMIDGEVIIQNEEFFIKKYDGRLVNFSVEAEGLKKIGLLWQLIMNENIAEDSILIWDEPEANLNPDFIPDIVECLLELARHNVQIFISTHNYLFAKYFDVRRSETDSIEFHSLYTGDNGIQAESKDFFDELEHNEILKAFDKLLDEVYELNEE